MTPNQTAVSAIEARKSLVSNPPATQTPSATTAATIGMARTGDTRVCWSSMRALSADGRRRYTRPRVRQRCTTQAKPITLLISCSTV